MKLSKNVGTPDRIIRLAMAGLLGVALVAGSVTGAAASIAGAVAVYAVSGELEPPGPPATGTRGRSR